MQYRGLTLDAFQERAIKALQRELSVLVCAPTGTGKTIIADWIVEEALSTGKRVIYTAPIKALSNQKFRDYCRLHGDDKVGLVTGDLVIRREAPCLVMTTEILRNMLLTGEQVEGLLAVVLDEIHFLDDRERGTVWEEVLIYLPQEVRIVGLSATLSNQREFAGWLEHVRKREVEVVVENRRAVPLRFYHFCVDTGLVDPQTYDRKYRKRGKPTRQRGRGRGSRGFRARRSGHIDVFHAMWDEDLLPYLFFVFSRRDTEVLARALARNLGGTLLDDDDLKRAEARLSRARAELGDEVLTDDLREMYRRGVAFHHAGLHVQLKTLVEELYEDKLLKVLYCTSTFALGINMPARSVVFDGLKKFDGRAVNPLTTRGFMQKAGRAGRRGMDDVGHVVLRMDFAEYGELQPLLERYEKAIPEPVRSSFNLSFNSIVNLLERHDRDRIQQILDQSFLAWHLDRKAEDHTRRAEELRGSRKGDKQADRLESRAARARSRVQDDFVQKLGFLKAIGYFDDDLAFNAGAKVLRHVYISEVFVTELILSGLLEDLEPARLFGVCSGLTNSLPRQARPQARPTPEDRDLARQIKRIRHSQVVMDSEALSGLEVDWDPEVMLLGRMWAEGRPLTEIADTLESETDLAGDLVTGFRRAKDLIGQLADVYVDLPERRELLRKLARDVSRDEVEVVG